MASRGCGRMARKTDAARSTSPGAPAPTRQVYFKRCVGSWYCCFPARKNHQCTHADVDPSDFCIGHITASVALALALRHLCRLFRVSVPSSEGDQVRAQAHLQPAHWARHADVCWLVPGPSPPGSHGLRWSNPWTGQAVWYPQLARRRNRVLDPERRPCWA